MSMYGDSRSEWNDLLEEIESFLEENKVSDLMRIVTDAVERKEGDENG